MMQTTINERVKILRNALGYSQKKFGEALGGLSQGAVSAMEKPGGTITEKNILTICKVFDVNYEWILNGDGEIFTTNRKVERFYNIFEKLMPEMQDYLIKMSVELLFTQNTILQKLDNHKN